ncbi:TfuA-like protein [Aestuariispira insulae]|uniref:TfuA-like core domain-containing protein n=1 Tax=Aestuariispira insulae TaxID=1461337 RepID=A0A3D9HI40_9PROT|nr:TfuA-like protein [Aestuariispira insulae]RED48626.1 hypothetical protein DFP90_107130 [Aestuariispira insulae]
MTICVFLGPTLAHSEAQTILDAVYLPPVAQGDIIRAVEAYDPQTLVLIDGLFEQTPAVWHKEILWALEQGRTVCGASSMGALRAAELCQFGMIGHGRIYQAYRDGVFPPFTKERFEDDDEVAVIHAPKELAYAGSVAMVDIRATLDAAEQAGIIDDRTRDRLARLAKSLFYKNRHYPELLRLGRADGHDLDQLEQWLETGRINQKRLDAESLLHKVAAGEVISRPPTFRFEETTVWDAALQGLSLPSTKEGD